MSTVIGKRAQARRERVLQAAGRVFMVHGIERTTVDQVIDEAGVSRATFYRAFPSLEAVIEALYEAYERDVIQRLRSTLTEAAAEDGFQAVVEGVFAEHEEQGAWIRLMFREELRPCRGIDSMHRRVLAQRDIIRDWWTQRTGLPADDGLILCLILLLQSAGLFSDELDGSAREALKRGVSTTVAAVVRAHVAAVTADGAQDA